MQYLLTNIYIYKPTYLKKTLKILWPRLQKPMSGLLSNDKLSIFSEKARICCFSGRTLKTFDCKVFMILKTLIKYDNKKHLIIIIMKPVSWKKYDIQLWHL